MSDSAQRDRSVSKLIDSIYASALDVDLWPGTLAMLADLFDGTQATLYSHNTRDRRADVHAQSGLDPAFLRSYVEHFGQLNPFVDRVAELAVGVSATAEDLVRRDVYHGGEFFNDWVRPQGCLEFITTNLFHRGDALSGITVLRGARAFDRHEKALWGMLASHLRRALQVHRELYAARVVRDGAVETLDRLSIGALVVGAGSEVIFANVAAEAALRGGHGLRARGGRLCGETPSASGALDRAISAAAATGAGHGSHPGGVVVLPSRDGRSVPVLVSPLRVGAPPIDAPAVAALVLLGGERQPQARPEDLAKTFGLTAAESRLLSALVAGQSLSDHATAKGIAIETVRAHLRQVLAKTGTNRQSAAIRRVLTDPVLAHPARPR